MQEQERVIFSSNLKKSPIILKLTWEEKVKICEEWKQSGLGKKMFCKQKGIAPATFHGWCQKLWDIKAVFGNKLCAVKVVDKDAAVVKINRNHFNKEPSGAIFTGKFHLLQIKCLGGDKLLVKRPTSRKAC